VRAVGVLAIASSSPETFAATALQTVRGVAEAIGIVSDDGGARAQDLVPDGDESRPRSAARGSRGHRAGAGLSRATVLDEEVAQLVAPATKQRGQGIHSYYARRFSGRSSTRGLMRVAPAWRGRFAVPGDARPGVVVVRDALYDSHRYGWGAFFFFFFFFFFFYVAVWLTSV
jgi:hypothetical protein